MPVLDVSVLADSWRLGDAYFMAIGPAVIFLALIGWITVLLTTSRKRRHYRGGDDGLSHRGPVMGGIIQGSPSQRTRRDPAPSVTHRQVMAHIEHAREVEEAERHEARRPPARARRRFRPPRLR
ncbi:hypothetical protein E1293_34045 [Actinomadura darangshiensis]|uniref:Uncharacterized protein n=1 Tax=Actinomadura darangshiensis TaxID=705336 RepID=A0A4R5ALX7_9ACTN|nr:hypothetical protein [Actinomadura darangshiensis]TDD71162.1 hypothetical protein E1293_34045 [Actinomadura darangshiensis]